MTFKLTHGKSSEWGLLIDTRRPITWSSEKEGPRRRLLAYDLKVKDAPFGTGADSNDDQ
jgi:hypothetical protein